MQTTETTGRGVFMVPFLNEDGQRILVAISKDNRRLAERPYADLDEGEYKVANRALWALLNERDPDPTDVLSRLQRILSDGGIS